LSLLLTLSLSLISTSSPPHPLPSHPIPLKTIQPFLLLYLAHIHTRIHTRTQPYQQAVAFDGLARVVATLPTSADSAALLMQLQTAILQRLNTTLMMAAPSASAEAREKQSEVQSHVCHVLISILETLSYMGDDGVRQAASRADEVMQGLLAVLACHPHTLHTDAVLTIGQVRSTRGMRMMDLIIQI
jgi:hypothetical protein